MMKKWKSEILKSIITICIIKIIRNYFRWIYMEIDGFKYLLLTTTLTLIHLIYDNT